MTKAEQITSNFDILPADEELFDRACAEMITRPEYEKGIGTLGEKSIHSVLKYYFMPDTKYHEIRIGGPVADACREGEIFEIQSRNFHALRKKLAAYPAEYDITIVYPVITSKNVIYIDPQTGEIMPPSRSPKHMTPYDVMPELIYIRDFLRRPGLHITLCLLTAEEYRLLDGYGKNKKIHATKTDRIPVSFKGTINIDDKEDFLPFLPQEIRSGKKDSFTAKECASLLGIDRHSASCLCSVLCAAGTTVQTGTKGKAYVYSIAYPQ